ncbi:hypothetical protein CKA32_005980 [Geitlerinema sp. FC II]|nr:hypothetical protein CKA32_005980 [Geitlerinema sp. FC II]
MLARQVRSLPQALPEYTCRCSSAKQRDPDRQPIAISYIKYYNC